MVYNREKSRTYIFLVMVFFSQRKEERMGDLVRAVVFCGSLEQVKKKKLFGKRVIPIIILFVKSHLSSVERNKKYLV